MKTKPTNKWRIWSLDTLGNDADGYEFNDRREIGSFVLDPSEIENETDEKAIEHVFSSLENQDHDFSFSEALKNETITAVFSFMKRQTAVYCSRSKTTLKSWRKIKPHRPAIFRPV